MDHTKEGKDGSSTLKRSRRVISLHILILVSTILIVCLALSRPASKVLRTSRTLHPSLAEISRNAPAMKFPQNARLLGSHLSAGFRDRTLAAKIEIDQADAGEFLAFLPPPVRLSKTLELEKPGDEPLSWWDPESARKFVMVTVTRPAGKTSRFPLRLLIKLDDAQRAVIYMHWCASGWSS